MHGEPLYSFYENVLLPQFGILNAPINWKRSEDVGPDETVHYFSIDADDYALIFEDYDGLGRMAAFVKENVDLKADSFEYVVPTSHSNVSPSYSIKFPTPYRYCVNVTGTFTLIRM